MVLGYSVHSTDSGSLILGSSADDEVIQEGLLRLRSVSPTAPCAADFANPRRCSAAAPLPHGAPRAMRFPGRKREKSLISPTGFAARDVPRASRGTHELREGCTGGAHRPVPAPRSRPAPCHSAHRGRARPHGAAAPAHARGGGAELPAARRCVAPGGGGAVPRGGGSGRALRLKRRRGRRAGAAQVRGSIGRRPPGLPGG